MSLVFADSRRDRGCADGRVGFALVACLAGTVDGSDVRTSCATGINNDSFAHRPWQLRDLRKESVRMSFLSSRNDLADYASVE
jgi:hypothetical protein